MKTCLSLLTCDRPELVEQSIKPLIEGARQNHYHLFVVDGSTTEAIEDKIWHLAYPTGHMIANVRGGAGAAIVYALTMMLNHEENYDYVGLVESDVLLGDGWLDCLGLFERGREEGLAVGAVSARAYEDRTLFQRDGYAVMHNLGAGMIVFTREAARLVLDNFRTAWSTDNRTCGFRVVGHGNSFRPENRMPGADANPYLAIAASLAAGLAGMDERLPTHAPARERVFDNGKGPR